MTSAPVTASTKAYFTGTAAAAAPAGTDADNSFSDVLKSQKNDGQTRETVTPRAKRDEQPEKISEPAIRREKANLKTDETVENGEIGEVSLQDMEVQGEEAVQTAVYRMLTQTAEELDMTEEEVVQLLDELGMIPMDLLQTDNLQMVVLAAAGETDPCSFVTNEQLFTELTNLTASLEEVISQVAGETGLDTEQVTKIFSQLMEQTKASEMTKQALVLQEDVTYPETDNRILPVQQTDNVVKTLEVKTPEEPEKVLLKNTDVQTAKPVEIAEMTTDGSDVMNRGNLFREETGREPQNPMPQETPQNPFMQNLMVKEVAAETVNITETQIPSYFDADTEMILHQITDYMKGHVTDGVSELEMQLHPESLGNLHVKLTSKEGMVTAQFTAQNDTVKTALESQMIQLKETFKEQGITVEAIEVTVESHKFDEGLSQNAGGKNGESGQAKRQGSRRINLNLNLQEEEADFSEEERLAAELLRDSGGTVDYTA